MFISYLRLDGGLRGWCVSPGVARGVRFREEGCRVKQVMRCSVGTVGCRCIR